jgi:hypothetical protein
VITDDEVMRLFERADPARVDETAPVIDADGYLATLRTRSSNVTVIDTEATPTGPTSRHRWLIAAAAAAVVAVVVGAIVLATRNDPSEPQIPAAPPTTVAPPTPDEADAAQRRVAAEELATGFLDAYGAFDADRAASYLTADAIAQEWGSPEQFRLNIDYLEAIGYKQTILQSPRPRTAVDGHCGLQGDSAAGVSLRCAYDLHALRSDEIGLGPFGDNYWDLTVRDGKIVSASPGWAYLTNGFSDQMWEPFAAWVASEYPDDVVVMYTDRRQEMQRLNKESIQLWAQRSREYVDVASDVSYIARAAAICTAAHARVLDEGEPRPFYNESWGRILDEALTELRALPPPEAVRAQFDQAYALVEQFADDMLSGSLEDSTADAIHQLEGLPGMQECTFHGPR